MVDATADRLSRKGGGADNRRFQREKGTRRSVLIADKVADWTIRIGGISVIIAVFGIMLFLIEVVVPLFTGGEVLGRYDNAKPGGEGEVVLDKLDEYKTLSVAVMAEGKVTAFHVPTGKQLYAASFDFAGQRMTARVLNQMTGDLAFGFADGSVRFGKMQVKVEVLAADQIPTGLVDLGRGHRTDGKAIYVAIPGSQFRRLSVESSLDEAQVVSAGKAIVAMDYKIGGTVERPTRAFVTLDSDGVLRLSNAVTRVNLLTRKTTTAIETSTLPGLPQGVVVRNLLMTDKADQVYAAEIGGTVYRFDTRDFTKPSLAERVDLTPGEERLNIFAFLNGEQSLVVGTSTGRVDVYFRLPQPGAGTVDGFRMVRSHALEPHGAAVVAMDASLRTKSFVTADADGNIWMRHSTSEQTLLKLKAPASGLAYETVLLSPRDDGVFAVATNGRYYAWDIDVPHPETTLKSIFGKIWYEGYPKPEYTWQSSSGTDTFEPKFSLTPLIFGTIKATFYCMLFAVPIALAAAIYTSEFVHPNVRAVVKPVMEMMASLPSVVLGFIAALILAPIVETWIAAVVMAFFILPLSLLVGAYLWQLMPERIALQFGGLPKFALMFVSIGIAVLLAVNLGGSLERTFFAGDFKAWANGRIGSDIPFMTLLLLPLGFVAASRAFRSFGGDAFRDRLRFLRGTQAGLLDAARWLALLAAAAALAALAAWSLDGVGLGVRGGMVDTYVQRNTLVVGFAMGFAVIPIIYTIAEDAMNAVPEHLRAASLACGATPWQTATAIILPTAFSGVFAGIMIGMGRAVGETMIVVMAAGNTPILEWNIFNGLRALSANIAVELPEAVKDDTLFRMLFLAALTLFVMTFVINTVAELIRQRFRKRAMQL